MANYVVVYSAQNGRDIATGRTFLENASLKTPAGIIAAEKIVLDSLKDELPNASSLYFSWFQEISPNPHPPHGAA